MDIQDNFLVYFRQIEGYVEMNPKRRPSDPDATHRLVEVHFAGAPQTAAGFLDGLREYALTRPGWRISSRSHQIGTEKDPLAGRKIDGVISHAAGAAFCNALTRAGIPHVELLPHRRVQHPEVELDNAAIGTRAAQYLADLGFRHFAFCGVGTPWSQQRGLAYTRALSASGLPAPLMLDLRFDAGMHSGSTSKQARAVARWLKTLPLPVAIFAAHDTAGALIVEVCGQNGPAVPTDAVILGVGNHRLACELCTVPLSSIDPNLPAVAFQGCALLDRLFAGETLPPHPVLVQPKPCTERRSSEALAFDNPLVRRIVLHIREHACEGLRVESLHRTFHISSRSLNRQFKQATGHSPVEEILRTRMRAARDMVTQTRLPLTEIAHRCGFSDQAHFSRQYRKTYGHPPREDRQ